MILKNISGQQLNLLKIWSIDEELSLNEEIRAHFAENSAVIEAINNSNLAILCEKCNQVLQTKTAIACLKKDFYSSLAVDKDGEDQDLSGNNWTVVSSSRILWDANDDYLAESNDFKIPFDGVYSSDGQIKIINISNCTKIELALFKRKDGGDDYWFILDEKPIVSGQSDTLLSYSTFFDFYEEEEYCLKIKLYGENASATINGEDDYTAWGYSFSRNLHK